LQRDPARVGTRAGQEGQIRPLRPPRTCSKIRWRLPRLRWSMAGGGRSEEQITPVRSTPSQAANRLLCHRG